MFGRFRKMCVFYYSLIKQPDGRAERATDPSLVKAPKWCCRELQASVETFYSLSERNTQAQSFLYVQGGVNSNIWNKDGKRIFPYELPVNFCPFCGSRVKFEEDRLFEASPREIVSKVYDFKDVSTGEIVKSR